MKSLRTRVHSHSADSQESELNQCDTLGVGIFCVVEFDVVHDDC